MLQPNCSELVLWMDEMTPEELREWLNSFLSSGQWPVVRNPEGSERRNLTYEVFETKEDADRAALIIESSNEERWRLLDKAKLDSATLYVDKDDRALWYTQHCQPQGFPLLKAIAEALGRSPLGWEGDDGGSPWEFREWLEKQST